MKYSHFETLALTIGLVSMVGVVLSTGWRGPQVEEVIAQALLFVVLVGAVHWGQRGGTATAMLAVTTYLIMRVPLFVDAGWSRDVISLVLIRVFTYAAVGIGGGALCGRIRYILARLDDGSSIDEQTNVFNQRFITAMLRSMTLQQERYGRGFSLVIITISDSLMADLKPAKQRSLLRAVATGIRNGVRLVDDVARLDDGRFLLVLPHTDKSGARVAGERVSAGVRRLLGAKDEAVRAEALGAEEDLAAIRELCGIAVPPDQGDTSIQASA